MNKTARYNKAMGRGAALIATAFLLLLSGCSSAQLASHYAKKLPHPWQPPANPQYKIGKPYQVGGVWYYPKETFNHVETGIASWYGPGFHGKHTANGEIYDQNKLTAAHRTLQLPSLVRVTNLENGRSIVVRVNDRGPFAHNRVIDMSKRGAELLGFVNKGTARVRLEVLSAESQAIAAAARAGRNTTQYATAQQPYSRPAHLPQQQPAPVQVAQASAQPTYTGTQPPAILRNDARMVDGDVPVASNASGPAPVEVAVLDEKAYMTKKVGTPSVPGHYQQGMFQPDPIVRQDPVRPTNIFVQAGAFTVEENATRLTRQLEDLAPARIEPAVVEGRQFYRVRLGPLQSVEQADLVIEQLIGRGHTTARVVIDDAMR